MGPEDGLFDEQPEIHAGEVPIGGTASGESSPERPNEEEKQIRGNNYSNSTFLSI